MGPEAGGRGRAGPRPRGQRQGRGSGTHGGVTPRPEAASARGWEPWRAGAAPLHPDSAGCGAGCMALVCPLPWSCPGVTTVNVVLGVMSLTVPLLPSVPPATQGK